MIKSSRGAELRFLNVERLKSTEHPGTRAPDGIEFISLEIVLEICHCSRLTLISVFCSICLDQGRMPRVLCAENRRIKMIGKFYEIVNLLLSILAIGFKIFEIIFNLICIKRA